MSQTQTAKQAANYEAKIALIQMGVKQFNDTVFIAPSFTSSTPHTVTVVEGRATFCSDCKGFSFTGKCAHGIAVLRFIAEEEAKIEAQAAAAQAVAVVAAADEWKSPANMPADPAWLWMNRRRFNTPAGRAYLAERAG
jgi:hypothetical protein